MCTLFFVIITIIKTQVLALDCNASTSVGLRNFKSYLASVKRSVTQVIMIHVNMSEDIIRKLGFKIELYLQIIPSYYS